VNQTQNQINKVALSQYRKALKRHLRSLITIKGLSTSDIVNKLSEKGVVLDERNLRGKISRGVIPGDLLFLIFEILGAGPNIMNEIILTAKGS